ncbi:MAG TPA: chemotaxis response regulator protein-glutamate methylesterase [Polyangia bacterium]|nr:chemotaxis response regulator protein-glutamate methylesterase [Polyangia bacterium]
MAKIRVLVVDDAVVVRRLVSEVIDADPELEVVGVAANGKVALTKIAQLSPDIVTLDVEMPEMDGLQTLRELRKIAPRLPVIMFSTLTERGAVATLDALSFGATDYVTKPANVGSVTAAMQAIRQSLIPTIKALCPGHLAPESSSAARPPAQAGKLPSAQRSMKRRPVEVVVIGTSTGGPNALAEVIPRLPANFPVPVVVVQHMPPVFTAHLARRLDSISALHVREGCDRELLRRGDVWIAPGDFHLALARHKGLVQLATQQGPPENSCRPAVDVLFRCAAEVYGGGVLAVVMTGMGSDGLRGCETVQAAGGQVLAQDEASSAVWGMPGAVARAGLADQVLPLGQLAPAMIAAIEASQAPRTSSPAKTAVNS